MRVASCEERGSSSTKRSVTSKQTVLLIDDDDDQRLLFDTLLCGEGLRVFSATSGRDALEVMSLQKFDLIVCDLRMPDMSGLDFVEAVRQMSGLYTAPDVPIIMLTACSLELEPAALEVGADLFCQKRVARTVLPEQIKFLLD